MRVLYRDGAMYDHPGISEELHRTIMEAPSKGSAIAEIAKNRPGVKISGPPIMLREPERRVIQTHDPDPCCSAGLTRALPSLKEAERWECPKCGGDWRVKQLNGVRHWWRNEMIEVI